MSAKKVKVRFIFRPTMLPATIQELITGLEPMDPEIGSINHELHGNVSTVILNMPDDDDTMTEVLAQLGGLRAVANMTTID